MIDRKALWIFIAVILAMTGATIWQLSLLPDWRDMPLGGPGSHNTVSGLVLRSEERRVGKECRP